MKFSNWGVVLIAVFIGLGTGIQQAWCEDDFEILSPEISLEELDLRLLPLTGEALEAVAFQWQILLQTKVQEITDATLAPTEDVEGEPTAAEVLVELRNERNAYVDRLQVVLNAWEKKGGDPSAHQQYIDAVSGLAVDMKDVGSLELLTESVANWITSEDGGLAWVFNVIKFAVIVVAFWFVSVFLGKTAKRAVSVSRNTSTLLRDFIGKSVSRMVFAVGLIMGLGALGIDIGPLLAAIGAAGFVVAFAMQDSLSNLASGIMILMYRPFDVGDYVEVAGVGGSVTALNLVSTTIQTPDNKSVLVPNNSVWGDVITNVTGSATRRVDLVFGIGYGDDEEKARKIMEDILISHESVLSDPESVVRLHELADSSVNFVCRPWVNTSDYWAVYWDVTRQVKEAFDKEGINIPFPQMDVHMHKTTES